MFPPIEDLVPHRKPMLLVDAITQCDTQGMQSRIHVADDNIFIQTDGTLAPIACLEMLAQSFAGGCGVTQPRKLGYLAAVRSFSVYAPVYKGDTLRAQLSPVTQLDNIVVVEGTLYRDDTRVAQAQFKIYTPDTPEI